MQYSNPKIPEGINISREHPLKDFLVMLGAVAAVVVLLVVLLSLLADKLVRFVPFELERSLATSINRSIPDAISATPEQAEIERYLQQLANRLQEAQGVGDGISVTLHYVDDDVVNAYATLGGHIVIFRGLLERLGSENTLSMLLAHEIAHVVQRDPLVAAGRGVVIGLAALGVFGTSDSEFSQQLIAQLSSMTVLGFSRAQESMADHAALQTLVAYYGHVDGAEQLFEQLLARDGQIHIPQLMSTHPGTENRLRAIREFSQGIATAVKVDLVPLPPELVAHSDSQ